MHLFNWALTGRKKVIILKLAIRSQSETEIKASATACHCTLEILEKIVLVERSSFFSPTPN